MASPVVACVHGLPSGGTRLSGMTTTACQVTFLPINNPPNVTRFRGLNSPPNVTRFRGIFIVKKVAQSRTRFQLLAHSNYGARVRDSGPARRNRAYKTPSICRQSKSAVFVQARKPPGLLSVQHPLLVCMARDPFYQNSPRSACVLWRGSMRWQKRTTRRSYGKAPTSQNRRRVPRLIVLGPRALNV